MTNMNYLRFRNTFKCLNDCVDNWYELEDKETDIENDEKEKRARIKIKELAKEIINLEV